MASSPAFPGHGHTVIGTAAEARHAINAIVKAPAITRLNGALSQDTPLAWPIRGRPWKRGAYRPS